MNTKSALKKAEIVLGILLMISVPLYALALFKGGISSWWYLGDAVVIIAWISLFILPNLLKQMKEERKQKKETHAGAHDEKSCTDNPR